ncbi:unnamed protein product [Effrenium voratum]|nr:unnamed protein product [Effrenium voratum]
MPRLWALLGLFDALGEAMSHECGEQPHLNWTSVREDLITYSTLSEPVMRSRRCFGDTGIWSYCGIAAMNILQMQPGLLSNSQSMLSKANWENPCKIGQVATNLFAMSFLTPGERYGMLWVAGDRLEKLSLNFQSLLTSGWPMFGLLSRLAEVIQLSNQARPVDACAGAACEQLAQLRLELRRRVAERGLAPEALARRVLAAVERVAQAKGGSAGSFAAAAAWAALAEAAQMRSDSGASAAYVARAESALRAVQSNYTLLDWLSSQWPTFRIMHRMQFDLLPREAAVEGGFWMQQDLVPRDPAGRPMRFVFNAGFFRPDALYIDVAADIVSTDMLRTLPAFFGIHMAKPGQRWNLGLAYTSNDYADLIPSKDLWRLQAGSQKLLFMPELNELLGEKDQQCRAYYDALQTWRVSKDLADQVGGMPPCFDMPTAADELRAFADTVKDQHVAFVRKPEGAWGGRGIEIRFRVEDVLGDSKAEVSSCEFVPLEDAQCLGLVAAAGHAETAEACSEICCAMSRQCEAWNWREVEGCWVGIPRLCTQSNPMFLGGWRGGRRLRDATPSAKQRAVVQQYVLDPVLYQLEGVWPPVTVKTDIRIYGTVVSMDPFRFYISEYGYFRSGFLEKNYSAQSDEDFQDLLMHVTHHIPKIEAGSYQCPTAPSWDHPEGAEHDAGSGGSLHKWFRIAKEQNGLDPSVVWKNIKLALAIFLLGARHKLDCVANAVPYACGSLGFHFFADLVVDRKGRAWLMEIHPTLAVKSPGLGDPEAGWVEVLTRSTRQGTLGSLAMSFLGWADAPYRQWVESILREKLLSQPRWRREVQGLARRLLRRRVLMPGWSGEAASVAGLLSKVLVEEHLSCRVAVVQVLPAMWGEVAELIARNQGDPFAGLRSVYRLLRAARPLLAREGPAPGDLRPRQCEAVDFNMGTRWDQATWHFSKKLGGRLAPYGKPPAADRPWERASRRFK